MSKAADRAQKQRIRRLRTMSPSQFSVAWDHLCQGWLLAMRSLVHDHLAYTGAHGIPASEKPRLFAFGDRATALLSELGLLDSEIGRRTVKTLENEAGRLVAAYFKPELS